MTRIPTESRDLLEKAIYYPMLIKVLERDLQAIDAGVFKLPKPYRFWIEKALEAVHGELYAVKRQLKEQGMKVEKVGGDQLFTTYLFVFRGYTEFHNYFNPRLRNKVEELLAYFLYGRFAGIHSKEPEAKR